MNVTERFLHYVSFETTSDEDGTTSPTTQGQRVFGEALTKELTAIEEQLGQEQILIQKFKMYAGMTQDQQLKACCEQIASKHEIHKNKLLNLLA